MPRRKKTAIIQPPPLIFVNSPVFAPAPVLTPDLAVDNPVTARLVPIDSILDKTWVSPQFRTIHCDQVKHQTSRRHHHITTNTRHRPDVAGSRSKFKPLLFVKDGSNDTKEHSKIVSLFYVTSESKNSESCVIEYKNNHRVPSIVDNLNLNDIVVHTPVLMQEVWNTNISPQQFSMVNKRLGYNKGLLSCLEDEACKKSALDKTPTGIVDNKGASSQGLLGPHKLFSDNTFANMDVPQENKDLGHHSKNSQYREDSVSSNTHEKDTFCCAKLFEHKKVGVGTVVPEHTGCSIHQKKCIPEILESRTPQRLEDEVVLVIDTPRCDYGLNFRQRQLKYR